MSSRPRTTSLQPRIALALAGGGPLGAIYEIGALCALQESLLGLELNRCHHYTGVSAGAFISAGLANGMTPKRMCQIFIEQSLANEVFHLEALLQPAWREYLERAGRLPWLLTNAIWSIGFKNKTFSQILESFGPLLPTGIFDNRGLEQECRRLLSRSGRTNDFRKLPTRLTIVATDLDSGEAALFGEPGWDHIPISQAITASAALPGLFPPLNIEGRHYVDGALKKTMHASVALEEGVDLLFCLNPLVPFHVDPHADESLRIPPLVDGGLPAVMNQTFRSLIHSRMALGMRQYEKNFPNTDIILIEPDHRDSAFFSANTFSYSQRESLAEHGYQYTRQWLLANADTLQSKLDPHGITLNLAVLNNRERFLIAKAKRKVGIAKQLRQNLDALEKLIPPLVKRAGR